MSMADYLDLRPLEPPPDKPHPPEVPAIVRRGKELLTLKFEIPDEFDTQVDFTGMCQCDECRKSNEPVRLYRGMTVFVIEDRQIYCDCMQEYLRIRQVEL